MLSKKLTGVMIRLLAFLGVFAAVSVSAQAPTEERLVPAGNRVSQGQQRLGFLNRELDASKVKVRQSEAELLEARAQEGAAQKQLDSARKRREAAGMSLDRARREQALRSKAYERESAEFERMLKGGASNDTPKVAPKKQSSGISQ